MAAIDKKAVSRNNEANPVMKEIVKMKHDIDKIAVFSRKGIRRQLHNGEWWFAVAVLTNSADAGAYWRKLKQRLVAEGSEQTETNCHGLKMTAADGKQRVTDAMKTDDLFRLIQSIPSKKAEPFKRWLAHVGYERVQEIENPELAQKRMKALYKANGYDDTWIERRVRGIAIRQELTDERDKRGGQNERDYAILTAGISKATFGITPSQYKKLKGLQRENLRDHMNDLELLFSQLGEAATTEIARTDDAQGMNENMSAANRSGAVAGNARKQLETETGRRVISKNNFLQNDKRKKLH